MSSEVSSNINEKDGVESTKQPSYYDYVSEYLGTAVSHVCSTVYVAKDKLSHYLFNDKVEPPKRVCEEVSYYNQYSTSYAPPTPVRDNIYLGSAYNAANYSVLKEAEIDIIINITNEIQNYYPEEFQYVRYELDDSETADIEKYLEDSYKVLKERGNKKVLVHCYMGASRSASIIIYYLMKEYKMTFDEALQFLKSKRIVVNPNKKFATVLKAKESQLVNAK